MRPVLFSDTYRVMILPQSLSMRFGYDGNTYLASSALGPLVRGRIVQ